MSSVATAQVLKKLSKINAQTLACIIEKTRQEEGSLYEQLLNIENQTRFLEVEKELKEEVGSTKTKKKTEKQKLQLLMEELKEIAVVYDPSRII